MSAGREILASCGAMKVIGATLSPDQKKCLLLQAGAPLDKTLPVKSDKLRHNKGGIVESDLSDPPRLIAVPGLNCTLMDVATAALPLFQEVSPGLSAADLSVALLAYNWELLLPNADVSEAFDPTLEISRKEVAECDEVATRFENWTVGTLLTLPLELDIDNGRWVTDADQIALWAQGYAEWMIETGAKKPDDPNKRWACLAAPLALPNAWDLPKGVQEALAASDPSVSAKVLRQGLLRNPFADIFCLYEVFCQQKKDYKALVKLVCDIFDSSSNEVGPLNRLDDHHIALLGCLSAGNAFLRRSYATLMLAPDDGVRPEDVDRALDTKARSARGLQLVPVKDASGNPVAGAWSSWLGSDPEKWYGPAIEPFEPPLVPSLTIRTVTKEIGGKKTETKRYLRASALGRLVYISQPGNVDIKPSTQWTKLSYAGATPALEWLAEHRTQEQVIVDLASGTEFVSAAKVLDRAAIAANISGNEGGLDSVQAGDAGIVSFGMQQWAAHTDDELTVLFERYRQRTPDYYDLFFGMLGMQTRRWANKWVGKNAKDPAQLRLAPSDAEIDEQNPYGPDPWRHPDLESSVYIPSFVTLYSLPPGKSAVQMSDGKSGPRWAFFIEAGHAVSWCARARLAGLCSRDYSIVQVQTSAWRFTRIRKGLMKNGSEAIFTIKNPNDPDYGDRTFSVMDLFNSAIGAAAILDSHINWPAKVETDIKNAIARTAAALPPYVDDPDVPTDEWLSRMTINYMGLRQLNDAGLRTKQILSRRDIPWRTWKADELFTEHPRSFTGW